MRRTPRRAAFTLVELLVVIGIITVLVAILLPSLNKARDQAIKVQCLSNLHQITIAVIGYAAENRGYVPGPHAHTRPNCLFDPFAGNVGLPVVDLRPQFENYVKDLHVFYCPANLDQFYLERPADPLDPGWFEGWRSTSGFNSAGYAYWPQWIYDGVAPATTIWTNPEERPTAKLVAHRRILWTDLSQDLDPAQAILPRSSGYIWYSHGRGSVGTPYGSPRIPTWAAHAYTDGSVVGTNQPEWQLRVKGGPVASPILWFYW